MHRRYLLYGFVAALVVASLLVGWQWKGSADRVPLELASSANKTSTRETGARDTVATKVGSNVWREQMALARGQSPARDVLAVSTFQVGIGEADITAVIKRLLKSSVPNDWYKATVLNILCSSTGAYKNPLVIEGMKDQFRKAGETTLEFLAQLPETPVLDRANRQCGEAGALTLIVEPDLFGKSARGGSALALADLNSWGNYKDGLSSEQQKLTLAALGDAEGRTAWLTLNQSRLALMMDASRTFPEATYQELRAALLLSLCYFGDDCGTTSLHMITACPASLACSSGNVEDAVFASLRPERQGSVATIALAIVQGVERGDLAAIGLTGNKGRSPAPQTTTPTKPPKN